MSHLTCARRVVVLVSLAACSLAAQVVTGTISGRVTDTSGAVVPGTAIQIQNLDTGFSRTIEADASGRYAIQNLPLGIYSVTAQRDGFQTAVRRGITLTVGSEAVINIEMSVGAVQEKVEVIGEAPSIETTTATLSSLVNQEQMRELPLNGRSYDQLANIPDRPDLAPGAGNNPAHGTSAGCQATPGGQKLGTPDLYFDPCSFTLPAIGTYGNLARNTLLGPGLNNVDFTLGKETAIRERTTLEFRAEFFNLLNRARFGAPNTTLFNSNRTRNGNAGRVTNTANDNRQIQFGMKFTF